MNTCGHLFCEKCLRTLVPRDEYPYYCIAPVRKPPRLTRTLKCPTCRTACEGWFEDKNAGRRVNSLQVNCSNRSCEWKGSLCQLDDHKAGRGCQGCQYEPVFCTSRCGEKVVRRNLEEHKKNECVLRPENCRYCRWLGTHESMNNHYLECQKYPIPCPNNCGKKNIPVQEVEGHLQECPEQVINCVHSNLGCRGVFKRRTSESHYKDAVATHLSLSLARVDLLTQIVIEMRGKGPSNGASASTRTDPLSFLPRPWLENTKLFPSMPRIIRFDQFSKKKKQNGVRWTSDPFFTTPTGYKLCLQVYANGNKEENKGHISVFTVLQRGPNEDILSWPFDRTVSVTLLNQLEDRHHHFELTNFKNDRHNFSRIEPGADSAATGLGQRKFISHGDLDKKQTRNCQYLRDDCLFFKIELK